MAKKKKTVKPQSRRQAEINPEKSRYFLPAMIVVMLVGVIILFGEFIFSNKMLFGSDTINAGIFFRHFYVEYVKAHGAIPLWNPYIFGGLPFIDAFHGDIFYPLSTLKFFGDFYRMLGMNLVIHIFLAGLFMYMAARQFRLSKTAAALSGICYMFSGYLVSLVAPGHDGKIFVTTLFPLVMLFLDRAFERRPVLNFTLLGLVIGVIILSPHPQLSYYMLWAAAFYGAFRLINLYLETRSLTRVIYPGALLAGAVVIGLGISAIQFYPGYIYTNNYSPRADTKRGYEWATSWSMNTEEAVSLVVPEFSGTNSGEGNYYWGKNAFKDNSEYAGVITLFLAVIAVAFYRRKEAIFFAALAFFAFIYALGGTTPIFRLFYYLIPNVKSLRAPSTIMFVFLFSVSLLAGMAIQFLIEKGRELRYPVRRKLGWYLIIVPAVLAFLAILFSVAGESMLSLYTAIFYGGAKTTMVARNVTKWTLAVMNLPNIQVGLWIVTILVGLSAAAVWAFVSRRAGLVVFLLLPLLGMIDGLRFNARFVKTYDHTRQFSPNPLSNYLAGLPGQFRVLNLADRAGVSGDILPFFGIEVVTGYHGNQLRWYDDLLGGPSLKNRLNPHFLNLVNTKYVLAPDEARLPPDLLGERPLAAERTIGALTVYRNDNALPRAFLVRDYEVIEERSDIYPLVLAGDIDPGKKVILEESPEMAIAPDDSAGGRARIVSYAVDSVLVEISTPVNALLILTDNYYRSWEAFVDGRSAPLLRAYGAFRAVPVEAGATEVLFKYDRSFNSRARAVTVLTLLLVAIILVFHLVRYLKERNKATQAA